MKTMVMFLITCLIPHFAMAAPTSRLHASEDYEGKTWGLLLGGTYTSRVLKHDEISANPSFVSSDRRVRVDDVRLSFTVIKEFFNPSDFSITVSVQGGVTDSSGTSQNPGGDFEEKLESRHF
jgi:hypothetical protein